MIEILIFFWIVTGIGFGVHIGITKNPITVHTFRREMEECLRLNAAIIVHPVADGHYKSKDIPRLEEINLIDFNPKNNPDERAKQNPTSKK